MRLPTPTAYPSPHATACTPGLFFFHNPKAGGTAISRVFRSMFPPEEHCPLIENSERDHERQHGDYAGFRGYRYYGGHYGYDIFEAVDDRHDIVTNFRAPAARLLSLYNFYRLEVTLPENAAQLDDLYPVLFAQQADFRSFITTDDPRIELHTRNHHVRQLTSSGWNFDSEGDLAHAKALLERMPWFYVCEHPERSEQWGREVFRSRFIPLQRENVTRRSKGSLVAVTTIDAATLRAIHDKNLLDEALHAHATQRLLRTRREVPASMALASQPRGPG